MNQINAERSFWQRCPGYVIRWVVFLPLAFLLSGILQETPLKAAAMAMVALMVYKPEINFLTILLAVVVVPIVGPLLIFFLISWGAGVVASSVLCCRAVAPKPQIAAVVFGTLFCLAQAIIIFGVIQQGYSWVLVTYHVIFDVLTLVGIVIAYKTPAA